MDCSRKLAVGLGVRLVQSLTYWLFRAESGQHWRDVRSLPAPCWKAVQFFFFLREAIGPVSGTSWQDQGILWMTSSGVEGKDSSTSGVGLWSRERWRKRQKEKTGTKKSTCMLLSHDTDLSWTAFLRGSTGGLLFSRIFDVRRASPNLPGVS